MDWLKKLSPSDTTHIDDGLESYKDYNERWRSIRIIYFTMFLMSLGFSIILTGIWPYLDKLDPTAGKEFMGIVVGANPLGQMIFSPLFGYWGNKLGSIRLPLLCSLALFTVASGIYSSLEVIPNYTKYWMLISRFLVGVSSANIAVCRSYLSAATRIDERTGAVSMVSLAQVLGFIVGPGLQAAVIPLKEVGVPLIPNILTLNMYTAAGWINVLMGIINFLMFLPAIFKERKIAAREIMILQGKENEKDTWKSIKPDYISAWTLIIAFFVLVFNFVLLETLGTSLTMDQFAWSKTEALYYMGILMSVGAVIACVTFVCIGPLCKFFEERYILIWGGFLIMFIGRILHIPWGDSPPKIAEIYIPSLVNSTINNGTTTTTNNNNNNNYNNTIMDIEDIRYLGCPKTQEWCEYTPAITITQFILGYALTSVGYPIGVTLIQTIFSKILGPRPQGVWMGLMTGSGCFSRVMGPVFVGYIYTRLGTYWTFGFTSIMMFIFMIWLWLLRNRLIPPTYERPSIELQNLQSNNKEDNDANISSNIVLTTKSVENNKLLENGIDL